ncbi:hypothetical protein ABRP17_007775 [Stenotrophomonas sp. WHRI 8082]|uniref:hypothetical protein n=1 Tax=Stenotrophomonas sp. WHRI 8082 TaxID=3162571 RepID=UPI0032EBE26D
MIRPPRHRRLFLLRLLMLVVVALGTAGGALASALGDLHELSHADHPAVPHGSLESDSGHDDEEVGDRLLHALVHCGHCHGQGGQLPMGHAGWCSLSPGVVLLDAVYDAGGTSMMPDSLLRPPIQG